MGLTHGFSPKMAIFPIFFFLGNLGQQNVFYDILERKNVFLSYKNKMSKKSKNSHFSKGVDLRFWPKNGHFSNTFFLGNIGQDNVFYDIVERKNVFLSCKNKKSKKSKYWFFPKGLTHGFGPKMAIFPTFFFLGNIDQENVFYDILEQKNVFLSYKNKKFKKWKNCHFSKGVHGFVQKLSSFQCFF